MGNDNVVMSPRLKAEYGNIRIQQVGACLQRFHSRFHFHNLLQFRDFQFVFESIFEKQTSIHFNHFGSQIGGLEVFSCLYLLCGRRMTSIEDKLDALISLFQFNEVPDLATQDFCFAPPNDSVFLDELKLMFQCVTIGVTKLLRLSDISRQPLLHARGHPNTPHRQLRASSSPAVTSPIASNSSSNQVSSPPAGSPGSTARKVAFPPQSPSVLRRSSAAVTSSSSKRGSVSSRVIGSSDEHGGVTEETLQSVVEGLFTEEEAEATGRGSWAKIKVQILNSRTIMLYVSRFVECLYVPSLMEELTGRIHGVEVEFNIRTAEANTIPTHFLEIEGEHAREHVAGIPMAHHNHSMRLTSSALRGVRSRASAVPNPDGADGKFATPNHKHHESALSGTDLARSMMAFAASTTVHVKVKERASQIAIGEELLSFVVTAISPFPLDSKELALIGACLRSTSVSSSSNGGGSGDNKGSSEGSAGEIVVNKEVFLYCCRSLCAFCIVARESSELNEVSAHQLESLLFLASTDSMRPYETVKKEMEYMMVDITAAYLKRLEVAIVAHKATPKISQSNHQQQHHLHDHHHGGLHARAPMVPVVTREMWLELRFKPRIRLLHIQDPHTLTIGALAHQSVSIDEIKTLVRTRFSNGISSSTLDRVLAGPFGDMVREQIINVVDEFVGLFQVSSLETSEVHMEDVQNHFEALDRSLRSLSEYVCSLETIDS